MASVKELFQQQKIPLYSRYALYVRIAAIFLMALTMIGCCGDSMLGFRNPVVQMAVPTPTPTAWGIQGPPQMMQMQYLQQAPQQYAAPPCIPAAPAPMYAPTYAPPPAAAPLQPCPEPVASICEAPERCSGGVCR